MTKAIVKLMTEEPEEDILENPMKNNKNSKYYSKNKHVISDNNKIPMRCKVCKKTITKGSLNLHKQSTNHLINELSRKFDKLTKQ